MKIEIFQSSQGLLSISINGKPSSWKIANQSGTGVWKLYKAGTHFMPLLQLEQNLAPVIHKSKELNKIVTDFISKNDIEPIKLSGTFTEEKSQKFEDCTPSNSAMIKGFKAVLDNPNASYESRKTAKDYFAYLAELADRADQKGGE